MTAKDQQQYDVPQLVQEAHERTKDYLIPTPLELCRRYVDENFLLSENEIAASIRLLFEQHRLVSEGSGVMSIGGLLKRKAHFKGKKVVAVVCGRNIDLEVFKKIIS